MRHHGVVLVRLRNPSRELSFAGPITVAKLMSKLDLNREAVLVVCNDALVPGDATLSDDDVIEIRPVISGGSR
jgi:sulfur carrier protein